MQDALDPNMWASSGTFSGPSSKHPCIWSRICSFSWGMSRADSWGTGSQESAHLSRVGRVDKYSHLKQEVAVAHWAWAWVCTSSVCWAFSLENHCLAAEQPVSCSWERAGSIFAWERRVAVRASERGRASFQIISSILWDTPLSWKDGGCSILL